MTESKILLSPFGLRNYFKDMQVNFLGCWACTIAWFCCGYKGIYVCTSHHLDWAFGCVIYTYIIFIYLKKQYKHIWNHLCIHDLKEHATWKNCMFVQIRKMTYLNALCLWWHPTFLQSMGFFRPEYWSR